MEYKIPSSVQIKLCWKTKAPANSFTINSRTDNLRGRWNRLSHCPTRGWDREREESPVLKTLATYISSPVEKHEPTAVVRHPGNSLHPCEESVYFRVALSSVIVLIGVFGSNHIAVSGRGASPEGNRCYHWQLPQEEVNPGKKSGFRETSPWLS